MEKTMPLPSSQPRKKPGPPPTPKNSKMVKRSVTLHPDLVKVAERSRRGISGFIQMLWERSEARKVNVERGSIHG